MDREKQQEVADIGGGLDPVERSRAQSMDAMHAAAHVSTVHSVVSDFFRGSKSSGEFKARGFSACGVEPFKKNGAPRRWCAVLSRSEADADFLVRAAQTGLFRARGDIGLPAGA